MNNLTNVRDLSFKSYDDFCLVIENEGVVLSEFLRELIKNIEFDGKTLGSEQHALGDISELGLSEETYIMELKKAMRAFALKKLTPVQALRSFIQNAGDIKDSRLRFIAYMNPIKDKDGDVLFGAEWVDDKLYLKAYYVGPETILRETVFVALR